MNGPKGSGAARPAELAALRRRPHLRMARAALLLALGSAAACEYPFGIGRAWVDGAWVYEAANLSGGGLTCSIRGVTLDLDQEGDTFAGVAEGGTLDCSVAGFGVTESLDRAPVGGEIDGKRVTFSLGARGIRHAGRIDGRAMEGRVSWRASFGDSLGVLTLVGDFAASREPREPTDSVINPFR